VHKKIISAVQRVQFVNEWISYIILRAHWCYTHTPTEEQIDDVKGSFYEEFEGVFDKLSKHHMKILLDVNAKVGKKDIFKPTIVN
jgi:hypothetical protein